MRKIAIFITALIIVCVGLLPWVDGIIFKKNYLHTIAVINRYHHVRIDVLDYQAGWFASSAKIKVTPLSSGQQPSPYVSFIIENNIAHGPIVTDKTKNSMTLAYASMQSLVHFPQELTLLSQGTLTTLEINTLYTLGNEWLNHLNVPSLALTLPGSGKLTWQGLSGNIDFHVMNNQITQSRINMQIGSFALDGGNQNPMISSGSLQAFSYQSEAWRQDNGLWKGNTTLTVPGIKVTKLDGTSYEANHFNLSSAVDGSSANAYRFNLQIGLQKLHAPNEILSDVSDINLSFIVDNINMQVAKELQNLTSMQSNENNADYAQAYLALFPRLVNTATTINQKLNLNTPLGAFFSTVHVSWPANTPAPATLSDMAMNADLTINIRAASALVDKLIESFDKMVGTIPNQPSAPLQPLATAQPVNDAVSATKDAYNQFVAQLMQQGQITLPQSLDLIGFFDAHNTAQQFAENVDKLGLDANTSMLLKQQYQVALNKLASAQTQTPVVGSVSTEI